MINPEYSADHRASRTSLLEQQRDILHFTRIIDKCFCDNSSVPCDKDFEVVERMRIVRVDGNAIAFLCSVSLTDDCCTKKYEQAIGNCALNNIQKSS